jgi:putative ubiquitin-RnfH superfamily antitoxin RatB of RatAB toxin-antitoxin module
MAEAGAGLIDVEVVYALPRCSHRFRIRVAHGATVEAAIRASGILSALPELDGPALDVGIFGRCCSLRDVVKDGDRIEIYRPLALDPKEARRRRAAASDRG